MIGFRGDMIGLRGDANSEINGLRTELVGEINDVRTDLGGQINDLRRELYETRRWLFTIWLGFAALFVEIALRT